MIYYVVFILYFLFIPEPSYAWGPLTHVYLAEQILSLPALISTGTFTMIKIFKEYFIYGNIIPDIVIGKKYLPEDKNPHSWKTGFALLSQAKTPEEKSFALGYLTHLSADAVLHNSIKNLNAFQHAVFEFKADRIINREYWIQIMLINKTVRKKSETFFEKIFTQKPLFSLKTSKKIYKSLIFLSALNMGELKNAQILESFHANSIYAMIDILKNQENSSVIKLHSTY
jgi:hypothetical protein